MKCQQCGRPPYIQLNSGLILCLDCHYKFVTINSIEAQNIKENINFLLGVAEGTVGLPRGTFTRYETKPTIAYNNQPVTMNNIQIDRSIVGTVNTGIVNELNNSMSNIRQTNQEGANLIKKLAEAVLKEKSIEKETKEEIIQQLNFLTQQLQYERDKRNQSVIKAVLNSIKETISFSADCMQIYMGLFHLFFVPTS